MVSTLNQSDLSLPGGNEGRRDLHMTEGAWKGSPPSNLLSCVKL